MVYHPESLIPSKSQLDWLYQPWLNPSDSDEFERFLFIKYPYSFEKHLVDYSKVLNWEEELPTNKYSTYLMKSEFWEYAWLKVEKIYKDRNESYITTNDIVDVEITLTNVSDKSLDKIVFAEKVANGVLLL